jgi:hypothetical protein
MEQLVGLGENGEELDASYEKFWRERPMLKEAVKRAQSVLEFLETEDRDGFSSYAREHPESVAEGAKDVARPITQRIEAQRALVQERKATEANPPPIPPRAMIPSDVKTPEDEFVRIAGQFDRKGDQVPRGFLRVVTDKTDAGGSIPQNSSGRVELARWLTDVEHGAGRLTARVTANRIWHHLMGRGLVATVDNFGRTGERPSHAALLDHLAKRLIATGWSIKALVKEIVMSRTFALSSGDPLDLEVAARARKVDPGSRLRWKYPRRRLDPESLRDAMLSASGQLDLKPMDSTVAYLGDQATAVGKNEVRRRTDYLCRSVYLPVIRNDLPELFEAFDFADPHATTGARPATVVATQSLFLMNDGMVMDTAAAMAKRLLSEPVEGGNEARIDRMFELALGDVPSGEERREFLEFIAAMEQTPSQAIVTSGPGKSPESEKASEDSILRAWAMACHAMFSTSRFQFLD